MDGEIIELSKSHPEETFIAECHWANEYYNRIIYLFEYRNGICSELGIKPGYIFFWPKDRTIEKKDYCAFKKHLMKYFDRLDNIRKEKGDFIIDKLNNEKDQYGYESYITITYENEYYKWTAEKTGISCIEISVEKKEPRVYLEKEFEDKMKDNENMDYNVLPF
jgi:hypothetical protein